MIPKYRAGTTMRGIGVKRPLTGAGTGLPKSRSISIRSTHLRIDMRATLSDAFKTRFMGGSTGTWCSTDKVDLTGLAIGARLPSSWILLWTRCTSRRCTMSCATSASTSDLGLTSLPVQSSILKSWQSQRSTLTSRYVLLRSILQRNGTTCESSWMAAASSFQSTSKHYRP